KKPFVPPLHQRHRERPVFVTHKEECPCSTLWIHGHGLLLTSFLNEISGVLPVLCEFAAKDNVAAVRPKNMRDRRHVKLCGCFDQGIGSLLRSLKAASASYRSIASFRSLLRRLLFRGLLCGHQRQPG